MVSRVRLLIGGAVQGVGFRPYACRLAGTMGLAGWVANDPGGVMIEVEGAPDRVERFVERLVRERPAQCDIQSLERERMSPVGAERFEIHDSRADSAGVRPAAWPLPDLATCDACRRELFDPEDRRYRHPFLTCTACGPRYTIIESLPYDRAKTAMRRFDMCPACQREYDNPADRRFHAQPIACHDCGPHLTLWDDAGRPLAEREDALLNAAEALNEGRIVAVKGLGGFHLMADAGNEAAVRRLRERKGRPDKPFALLVPSLEAVTTLCRVSPLDARLLGSPEAPIVLLRFRSQKTLAQVRGSDAHTPPDNPHRLTPRSKSGLGTSKAPVIALSVAPRNPYLGVMLPSTPLQHLLMAELGAPLVATSGNRSEEPICIDEQEALARLRCIADLFLVHDRPIVRPVDDSVVLTALGREMVLRRARGYAPRPVRLGKPAPSSPIVALGGHVKNTVAVSVGEHAVISQHLGDLGSAEGCALFRRTVEELPSLHRLRPARAVCDRHPDYRSTLEAEASGLPVLPVQHHHAHIAACMAEHRLRGPVLGVAWDGTGWGADGTIWGGEFLLADEREFDRAATFRHFRLPGGERAIREPRRSAIGLLWEVWGDAIFNHHELACVKSLSAAERRGIRHMLSRGIHSPETSSVGRLFDAVASLLGRRQRVTFDGQAAMELEWAAEGEHSGDVYPFRIGPVGAIRDSPLQIIDWEPMVRAMLDEMKHGVAVGGISDMFHRTLVEVIVAVAHRIGRERVVLGGGCFQNRRLLEGAVQRLRAEGFRPFWPHHVPPNDGGLALGQLYVAMGRSQIKIKGQGAGGRGINAIPP